ncbi:MAG: methyltransferase domain-containing protein [Patescibacteria group bacterium]
MNIDDVGKRYRFQTKLPIVGDEEGLLLTSYQKASEHTANRIFSKLGNVPVLEICSGVGGTTVFLAQKLKHVYAVDINSKRIEFAKRNAKTFEVADKITFINSDGLDEKMLSDAKGKGVEAVVSDVEWRSDLSLSLAETTPDIGQTIPSTPKLFEKLNRLVIKNIVMHMAANTNKEQLMKLGECEIEEMVYEGKVKFINVYFGALINKKGITKYLMN